MTIKLADINFDEAILREQGIQRKKDEIRMTTIIVQGWLEDLLEIFCGEYGSLTKKLSERKLTIGTLNHGTSIIKEKYDDAFERISENRRTILKIEPPVYPQWIRSTEIEINNLVETKRRSIYILDWCSDYLAKASKTLGMKRSGIIRCALYSSLIRAEKIPDYHLSVMEVEIDKFDKQIVYYDKALVQLREIVLREINE